MPRPAGLLAVGLFDLPRKLTMDFDAALERLLGRIGELGAITDTPGSLTRTFLSPANRQAARNVADWMEEAGMVVEHDVGGTVRGVLDGRW